MSMRAGYIAVGLLLCGSLYAQQTAPTFRSGTELVLIPTVVQDKSGAHIPNLRKEDFIVQENGVEQKIAVWEEVRTKGIVFQRAANPNTFTNGVQRADTPQRLTIVALDFINTRITDLGRARDQIIRFLENWTSTGEPLMLIVLSRYGVQVIQDYTGDPKVLAAAVRDLRSRNEISGEAISSAPSGGGNAMDQAMAELLRSANDADETFDAAVQKDAIQRTLDGMQQVARALAGVPGRKSLLWATGGFPFSVSDPSTFMSKRTFVAGRAGQFDVDELYLRTWHLLNDAQIAVYPVDVRGLLGPYELHEDAQGWPQYERIATFEVVAQETGGRAFFNTNDLSGAFRKAVDDSSSYYMLGYYRDRRGSKEGWHRLKVTVRHSGAEVRARNGFYVEKSNGTEKETKREISMAMVSPLDATSIVFEVRLKQVPAGSKKVPYELSIPFGMLTIDEGNGNHVLFDLEVLAKTRAGVAAKTDGQTMDAHLKPESLAKLREGGLHYENAIDLPPGEYTVRFLVRDGLNGRMGTVTAPVKVQ